MSIDWIPYSVSQALFGGALIGMAAAILVLFKGRIAGISGIIGGLLRHREEGDTAWRLAFLAGLLVSPWVYGIFAELPPIHYAADGKMLVVAGLLVGFGSRLGSGCTSGHGICGLSRLSPRSLTATLVFMTAGLATVFVSHHLQA